MYLRHAFLSSKTLCTECFCRTPYDWIVLAKDAPTKRWLTEFFSSQKFKEKFIATLASERGDDFKYAVKVQTPDSRENSEDILAWLFKDFDDLGYVRIASESRIYRDRDGGNDTNKAYHKALKKGVEFDDKGVPYIKTIWLRMNLKAHENIVAGEDKLALYPDFGICELSIERVKDKKKKVTKEKSDGDQQTDQPQGAAGPLAITNDGAVGDQDQNMEQESADELVDVLEQSGGEEGEDKEGEPQGAAGNGGSSCLTALPRIFYFIIN